MAGWDGAGTEPGWSRDLGPGPKAVLGLARVGCPGLWGGAHVWGALSPGVWCTWSRVCPVPFPRLGMLPVTLSDGQMKGLDLALGVRGQGREEAVDGGGCLSVQCGRVPAGSL